MSKAEIDRNGKEYKLITMEFDYKQRLWPWSGWLGIYVYAEPQTSKMHIKSLSGTISVDIRVIGTEERDKTLRSKWETHSLSIDYSLSIIPTPPRSQRILWDQFHNMQYPMGYFPRDDLERDSDMLDWFGDHPHSNYHSFYEYLKDNGYFVEVLRTDYSCIDPTNYATLLIVDPEDKFDADEVAKIEHDVLHNELSVIVVADWYNEGLMKEARFFDDNTRSVWDALTGGANIPALNELLDPFGIQFGDMVVAGDLKISRSNVIGNSGGHSLYFQTGNVIMDSPLHSHILKTNTLHQIVSTKRGKQKGNKKVDSIPLTMYDSNHLDEATKGGRIAVFGDSTCLGANQMKVDCFWLLDMLLHFTAKNEIHRDLEGALTTLTMDNKDSVFDDDYISNMKEPREREVVRHQFNRLSRVHQQRKVECPELLSFTPRDRSDDEIGDLNSGHRGRVIPESIQRAQSRNVADFDELEDSVLRSNVIPPKVNSKVNGYKFVVEPHLYGHSDSMNEGELGMFGNVMFWYPLLVIVVLVVAMYCFCPPIRRLLPCRDCGLKTRHSMKKTYRKIKGDQYYHV